MAPLLPRNHRCLAPFPELGSYAFSCGTASFVRTMRENADWIRRPALPISDVGSLYLRRAKPSSDFAKAPASWRGSQFAVSKDQIDVSVHRRGRLVVAIPAQKHEGVQECNEAQNTRAS